MKKKKICLKYKGKKINLEVEDCNFLETGRGLTFRSRERAPALMFDCVGKLKDYITSYFVFFDFLLLWCDKDFNVLEMKKVKPWSFAINSKTKWEKMIEIPISKRYDDKIKLLVGS